METELGGTYRDTVTGFVGICVCRAEWLHSCTRVTLTAMHNGDIKEFTFDEPQLEPVHGAERIQPTPEASKTGGGSTSDNPTR